jgi:repressor LexA
MRITERQEQVLNFLKKFIGQHGYSPTQREIQDGMGFQSSHAPVNHLIALERKGYIKRTPGVVRSIVVLK